MAEKLRAILNGVGGMTASLSGEQTLSADITIPKAVAVEEYAGPYEYMPSAEEQGGSWKEVQKAYRKVNGS